MLRLLLIGGLATAGLLLMRRSAGEQRARGFADGADGRLGRRRRTAADFTETAADFAETAVEEREQAMRDLADQLLFRLEKQGERYSLFRDADVAEPVRREDLTLDEVEEMLTNWKLRGFHGG